MIGRHRKAYPSGCSAASTAELASIDAAEVYYTAMADAALVNANSNADSVYNYTAAALPAQLTVSIAGINARLARQQTSISAAISAGISATNSAHTETLQDLDDSLVAANAAAALDDPLAIAATSRDAAAAVASAWQQVNDINSIAPETFAGMGPGGWGMTVDAFGGWLNEWGDILWAAMGGAGQGLAAWADGFIPFFDPFESFYDPADETLQWSVFFGGVSRDALIAAAIPNLGTWLRNPVMYEMGSMTIPARLFQSLSHLTPVARGQAIFRQLGWGGFGLGRLATAADWAVTYNTGGTPGARLLLVGLLHSADYGWEAFEDWMNGN